MENIKKALIALLFFAPIILVLKNFFDFSNPLAWGDAPYFYKENLKELINIPFAWDTRNSNFGNSQSLTLWLFIPTFLQGLLFYLFNINHEISVRIIFYFAFLFASIWGIFNLLKRFNLSLLAKILGTLFFVLNTYSLLLIDGGQIGVLLSYGLFPLSLLSFLNFLKRKTIKGFLLAILAHFLIFNSDLRIAMILIFLEFIWWILIDKKKLEEIFQMLLIYIVVTLLSSFWVLPFVFGLQIGSDTSLTNNSNFTHLINSFYLFQPHFPNNDFGNLNRTPIYFIFLPFILLIGMLNRNRRILSIGSMFLIFVFLSKGSNPPFGEIYGLLTALPMGDAFRDSSKFYIPAILLGSILLANSVEYVGIKFSKSKIIWIGLIYIFILISIYPAFVGGLTGILGSSPKKLDYQKIYNLIVADSSFRTLWFSERPPLGFADWNHPAVSANLLFQERPFASMIDGDYDLFGFLHNQNISNWYELLGIKYIFYPPYDRKKFSTNKEKLERQLFENFIAKVPGLEKLNLGLSFSVYQTSKPLPKIFGQEKTLFALGSDEIFDSLLGYKKYTLEKSGIVFLESCKFDPESIFEFDPKTYALFLSENDNDFYLSFFCRNFISPRLSKTNEWAINDSSGYLHWKSQLLERGIRNYDYDFNKGFAYSTRPGEKLQFDLNVESSQNYYLPIRYLTATESAGIKVDFGKDSKVLKSKNPNKLVWELLGPLNLQKGEFSISLINLGGLSGFNTLGLIPQDIFDQKKEQINQHLKLLETFKPNQTEQLANFLDHPVIDTNYRMINPTEYQVDIDSKMNWLIFSERFDIDWKLQGSNGVSISPIPQYSIINGYYITNLQDKKLRLYYQGQESIKKGMMLSTGALLLVGFGAVLLIISKGGYFQKFFSNSKN